MSNLIEYKGYSGTVEYSDTDKVLHGKILGIRSLLSYEGNSVDGLRNDFKNMIDDYLETCAEDGTEPEKPQTIKHHITALQRVYCMIRADGFMKIFVREMV